MSIEEIKEQLNDMQRLVYTHIEPDMYESHVKYLLSIIKQAEKALEEVYECGSIKQAEIISGAALQVIRGN